MPIARTSGRKTAELRPVEIIRGYTKFCPGSVLIRTGDTAVICSATVEESVPDWMKGKGRGWVSAEYDMLPGSTGDRRQRRRTKPDGRSMEIQRLIGRVLRAAVDLDRLGERCIWLDCDVLQADGGTRTASITGAYVAMCDAVSWLLARNSIARSPITQPVAAISVGKVDGKILLDLDYSEDVRAEVDFNVAMTGRGEFIELQGCGEGGTFSPAELNAMLRLAKKGITQLIGMQKSSLRAKPKV